MNLRPFVFLVLASFSSIASANWFDGYHSTNSSHLNTVNAVSTPMNTAISVTEKSVAEKTIKHAEAASYPVSVFPPVTTSVNTYFLPVIVAPKIVSAPSFDVVVREMEKIKKQQDSQEHALVSFLRN